MRFFGQARKPATDADARIAIVEPRSLQATTPAEREFLEIYQRLHARARRMAQTVVDRETARDVVQQAAMELWARWEKMQPEERRNAHRYFLRAVRHRALDHLRWSKRSESFTREIEESIDRQNAEFPDLPPLRDGMLIREIMDPIVDSMTNAQRAVWLLVMRLQLTHDEAAEALQVSRRTVQKHLELAKAFTEMTLERNGIRITDGTIQKLLPPPRSLGEMP